MPAKPKTQPGSGSSWGITWSDVGALIIDAEKSHVCTIQVTLEYAPVRAKDKDWRRFYVGVCCRSAVQVEKPMSGWAYCEVGGSRGAASITGAITRALYGAIDDLETRRTQPHKAQEVARLPGF